MNISKVFATLILGAAISANAQSPTEPADSVSEAMATIVANHVQPKLEGADATGNNASQQFLNGIEKALVANSDEEMFYQGIAQGLNIRENLQRLRNEGFEIDNARFLSEFRRIISENSPSMTSTQAEAIMNSAAKAIQEAEKQKQAEFLAQQAARPGVVTTPSGLIFEVITPGEGVTPTTNDTVKVKYTGRLANGKVFDSSGDNVVEFPVARLIKGFSEGLTMMKPGGTYRLFIPANIGYGERGAGNDIPPGAALDFTVTLVEIVK